MHTRMPHAQYVSLAFNIPPDEGLIMGHPRGGAAPIHPDSHCPDPLPIQDGKGSPGEARHISLQVMTSNYYILLADKCLRGKLAEE